MLRLLTTFARVFFGFVLASLAAGFVIVLFVNTPAEVIAEPASGFHTAASDTLDLALLTATHSAIFAAAFVMIAAGFGEWLSIRALTYYLLMGCIIAMLGVAAQYSSEIAGQPTILNNYAVEAFLAAGLFSGFVYWLASGRFAGAAPETAEPVIASAVDQDLPEADDEAPVVIARPEPEPRASAGVAAHGQRLLERLYEVREKTARSFERARGSLKAKWEARPQSKSISDKNNEDAEAPPPKPSGGEAGK